jgi:hypothetical protein
VASARRKPVTAMKRIAQIAVAASLAWLAALPAQAQVSPELKNPRITFAYVPPENPRYLPIMERLKSRQFLEKFSAFLSPLQLPHSFYLVTRQCGQPNAFYNPSNWRIEICYEIVELIDRIAPRAGTTNADGFSHDEVLYGSFVGVLLHEAGHAVFDMYNVPIFGREEDAADQMAAFIALNFNKDVALTITRGFAYLWRAFARSGDPKGWADFSDEHGTNQQRYFNTLCMGYGGNPELFKDFVDKGWLPKERAAVCAEEFQQVRLAFVKTVLPFINQAMMKKVQETDWLK